MEKIVPRLRELGGDVLAVTFTPPQLLQAFLAEHPLPFAIVSDPERAGYRAFQLRRTSFLAMLRPGVLGRYLRALFRGYRPTRPVDDDLLQLGGDVLIDAAGNVAWARPSRDATDRPAVAEMMKAIERISP